jgi:hypothetical protein
LIIGIQFSGPDRFSDTLPETALQRRLSMIRFGALAQPQSLSDLTFARRLLSSILLFQMAE